MSAKEGAVELAQKSDPGRDPDKQVNEDSCAQHATRFGWLSVVCDGMGGHAGGREASELAVKTISEVFDSAPTETAPKDVLRDAILAANKAINTMPSLEPSLGRPGSTCVAILLHERGTEVAHVGDSRCYRIHHGEIEQVTKDHSKVQLMVDAGMITAEEASTHPDANQITRALGISPEVQVDVRPTPVSHVAGDVFILCSDGLSDLVKPVEILGIAATNPALQAAGQLIDLANARGGHDNITVQIVRAKASVNVTQEMLAPTVAQTSAPAPAPGPQGTLLEAPLGIVPERETHVPVPSAPMPQAPMGMQTGQVPPAAISSSPIMSSPAPAMIPVAPARIPATTTMSDRPAARTSIALVIGLLLAVVGLGVLGVIVWLEVRAPTRKPVALVPSATAAPATTSAPMDAGLEADDAAPAHPIETAEPLPAPTPTPTQSSKRRNRSM